jgi:hypothetical protein
VFYGQWPAVVDMVYCLVASGLALAIGVFAFRKMAREMAVDYKSMNQISAIFEIYKTQSEQFLNANGRNWKEMYKAYTAAAKARKAAAQPAPVAPKE